MSEIPLEINRIINGKNIETRESMHLLGKDPLFTPVFDISIRRQKDLALARLKLLISKKLVSVKNFRTDPENIFTMHEMLGYIDGNLATKFTVQFNLFGGTIVGLGGSNHEEFLDKLDNLDVIGCFCLTELGYGNNAIEMETTATYDNEKKEFIINCPTIRSQKFWITNGAYHANYSIVFAQTYVNGKHEGINAFLVKMRNEDGSLIKGVIIDDMGHKMGLNGIDNARIIFKNVSTSSKLMLDKISSINEKTGEFSCKIKGKRSRFIYAANRLLSGRLCIASMCISATKLALAITIRYGNLRLSNGKSGKSDTPIFDYQLFQNQIIPLLCKTLIYNISLLNIREKYSHYILNEDKYSENDVNNIIRLSCYIKPLIAWHTNKVGNICRERCGGQGYLSINMVEATIYGAHSGITAEGDSSVLMQKVSKEYVEDFAKGILTLPYENYKDDTKKFNSKDDILLNLDDVIALIKIRESNLLQNLAEKTMSKLDEVFETWMLNESDSIQDLSITYGKRNSLESFINSNLFKSKNVELYNNIALLDALLYIKEHLHWYILNDFISKNACLKLDPIIDNLVKKIAKFAEEICSGFNIPKSSLNVPIYSGYQKYYSVDKTDGEHYSVRLPKF